MTAEARTAVARVNFMVLKSEKVVVRGRESQELYESTKSLRFAPSKWGPIIG